jgi:hypothetical protein
MPLISDYCFDAGLAKIIEGTRLDICTAEPSTYAEATATFSKGNKTGMTAGAAADRAPNGRKSTIPAVVSGAAGAVTGSGTVTHWAWTDPSNSRLLSAGALSASQAVTSGNTFTTSAFDIGFPDAV